jgi:tetratricopeptide (TPR) repeat protein
MQHRALLIAGFLLLTSMPLLAQQTVDEYRLQQEQMRKTALLRTLDSAVVLMDEGNYTVADKKFKYVLDNIRSVPSDLVYYFGKNSFYLQRYKQSIDWLNKYIQLKGTTGQFSQDAVLWLKKAEAEFVKEKSLEAQKAEQVLSVNYDIDCGPSGMVVCPVCKGDHVIVRRGPLGNDFRTCTYCNEHGLLTCEQYNKLVRGELSPK